MKRLRGLLLRLRAAITPQAAFLLAALLLAFFLMAGEPGNGDTALEERISQTLSQMEGAGRVDVTIHTRRIMQQSGSFGAQDAQEIPCGAVAVAQGADDPVVAMALREALCALLGLSASSVSIVTGVR